MTPAGYLPAVISFLHNGREPVGGFAQDLPGALYEPCRQEFLPGRAITLYLALTDVNGSLPSRIPGYRGPGSHHDEGAVKNEHGEPAFPVQFVNNELPCQIDSQQKDNQLEPPRIVD